MLNHSFEFDSLINDDSFTATIINRYLGSTTTGSKYEVIIIDYLVQLLEIRA